MKVSEYRVTESEQQIRLDKLLTTLNPNYSRSQVQSWINGKLVRVNDRLVKANYVTKKDDLIQWTIKEKEPLILNPENIPLSIIFEDDDLLIVNKQKGLVVHPSDSYPRGTLVNGLLFYTKQLAPAAGENRPGIVHRLDKDTSGLLIVAKTDQAYYGLTKQMVARRIIRKYQAVVHGVLSHKQGTIDAPIGRHPKKRQQMAVQAAGKHALTHFRSIEKFAKYTHVECQLETGRTHQIRVHLAHIGHPIVGDHIYRRKKTMKARGQTLHAYYLKFIHPITGKELTFTASLPEYFKEVLWQAKKDA